MPSSDARPALTQDGAEQPQRHYAAAHQIIVLVLEPDLDLAHQVEVACANGFVRVQACSSAAELLFLAGRVRPGLILMRANLPGVESSEVISTIREFDDVPIIVAVGKGETEAAGPALVAGANALTDHPYRSASLTDLVHDHIADAQSRMFHEARIEVGQLVLDGPAYMAYAAGRPVPLTPRAFEMLQLLVQRAGRVVPYEELRDTIWLPRGEDVSRQTVTVHMHRLREKLRGVAEITAIRRVGYRLTVCGANPAAAV